MLIGRRQPDQPAQIITIYGHTASRVDLTRSDAMQKNRAAMTGHHRVIIIAKLNNVIIGRIIAPHLFMAKIKRTGDMAVIFRTVRIVTPTTICGDLITGHFG